MITPSVKILIIILTSSFLISCAADEFTTRLNLTPKWVKSLETLPRQDGFRNAGMFGINDNVYAQFCDSHGNQKWFSYNKETHIWKQTRYETYGCKQDS